MTYASELSRHYAENRKRLFGVVPKQISRRAVAKAHNDDVPRQMSVNARWMRIVGEVAEKHDVPVAGVISRNNAPYLVAARYECFYRMRTEMIVCGIPPSMSMIGRWMCRDHSTVLHGLRRYCREHGLEMP